MSVTAPVAGLSGFAGDVRKTAWFSSVGQPPTSAEIADARSLADALGFPDIEINWLAGWPGAETAARNGSADWWDREEKLATRLRAAAGESAESAATLDGVVRAASDVTLGAAAVAANRSGIADPYLTRVAAGAASHAAWQAALAHSAGEGPDHPFAAKYRLFAAGRWPLGLSGGKLCIF